MKISDILSEEGIEVNLISTTKEDALNELVDLLNKGNKLDNIENIRKAIFERERLSSTGISNGLAIPHAKVNEIDKIIAGIGLSKDGIDFEAIDHVKSHIFFILISPKEDHGTHVKTLAKITKILKDETSRTQLLVCKNASEVIQFIKAKEEKI